MTHAEFADRLVHYAGMVREIRGVGRDGPHAFVEDKSEIIGAMMSEARELRVVAPPAAVAAVASIRPGVRTVGRREVAVVSRGRRP